MGIWHWVVTVNEWRARINANIDHKCIVCELGKRRVGPTEVLGEPIGTTCKEMVL